MSDYIQCSIGLIVEIKGESQKEGKVEKRIIQFFDGQLTRQRVVADDFVVQSLMKDYVRCGIDMRTVVVTNVDAENYDLGYLPLEYPLVGGRANGIWDFEQKESK